MKQFVLPFNPEIPLKPSGYEFSLSGKDFHYLIRVRRYSPGDSIPALSPDGRAYEMMLRKIEKDSCLLSLTENFSDFPEKNPFPTRITLIPALLKGRKMDLVIRQAVEGGAFAIWPVLSEYSQVKYQKESNFSGKYDRWNRIAVEALQQCGGKKTTEITPVRKLEEIPAQWNGRGPLFFLHEQQLLDDKTAGLHRSLVDPIEDLAIIIGPEGGLSPKEVKLLRENGGKSVYLGNRVLKAETAALYGLAAISTIIREKSEWQTV